MKVLTHLNQYLSPALRPVKARDLAAVVPLSSATWSRENCGFRQRRRNLGRWPSCQKACQSYMLVPLELK
jgi:hypothetical protein